MKVLKIILGGVCALWAILQAANFLLMALFAMTRDTPVNPIFYSHLSGVAVGSIIPAGLSFLLFRSALQKPPAPPLPHGPSSIGAQSRVDPE